MYCTRCGKEIGSGQKFCIYCGAPVEQNQTSVSEREEASLKQAHQVSIANRKPHVAVTIIDLLFAVFFAWAAVTNLEGVINNVMLITLIPVTSILIALSYAAMLIGSIVMCVMLVIFAFGRNQENYSVLWVGTGIGAITFFGGGCIEAVLRTICRVITSGEITGEFIIGAIGYGIIAGIVEILLLIMAKSLDKQNPIKGKNKSDFIQLAKTIPSAISSLFQK